MSMASSAVATRSFQQADQFTQQLTGHSLNPLSITPYFTLSLLSLFQWISFVMSQKNYLLSVEDLQCSVGVALGRVVTEEKKLCRDPERCPGMQLNRHCTHARIHHHYPHKREQRQQQIGRGGEKYIKKRPERGVALSAAGTLHHRLPLWKGGRGVDGGKEVLL